MFSILADLGISVTDESQIRHKKVEDFTRNHSILYWDRDGKRRANREFLRTATHRAPFLSASFPPNARAREEEIDSVSANTLPLPPPPPSREKGPGTELTHRGLYRNTIRQL